MKLKWLKIKISFGAAAKVLKRPAYSLLTLFAAFIILGILLWMFNLNLLAYIFSNSNISIEDKIIFFFQSYASVFTNFDSAAASTLLAFAILLGINIAVMVFVLRSIGGSIKQEGGKSGLSLLAAVLGAGCAACGTSLLTPILLAAGATTTIGIVQAIGVLANLAGIGLVLFSIYTLGSRAATVLAKEEK